MHTISSTFFGLAFLTRCISPDEVQKLQQLRNSIVKIFNCVKINDGLWTLPSSYLINIKIDGYTHRFFERCTFSCLVIVLCFLGLHRKKIEKHITHTQRKQFPSLMIDKNLSLMFTQRFFGLAFLTRYISCEEVQKLQQLWNSVVKIFNWENQWWPLDFPFKLTKHNQNRRLYASIFWRLYRNSYLQLFMHGALLIAYFCSL